MEEQKSVISSPKPITDAYSLSEESGWTQYIDDFTAYEEDEGSNYSGCSDSYMCASMVSDAGSGPEWKNKNMKNNNKGVCATTSAGGLLPNIPKRLNFKKKIPFDDSLEDTASSPVNSPKITAFFNQMDINSRKMENSSGSHTGNEKSIDERVEYNDLNREYGLKNSFGNNVECIELKQKGLCLVPISMVDNLISHHNFLTS